MSRYRFIRAQTPCYSVRQLCQVFGVGVASYYRWRQKVAARSCVPAWEKELCHVFFQHKRRYATPIGAGNTAAMSTDAYSRSGS